MGLPLLNPYALLTGLVLHLRHLAPPRLYDRDPGPRLGAPARPGTLQHRRRKLARRCAR